MAAKEVAPAVAKEVAPDVAKEDAPDNMTIDPANFHFTCLVCGKGLNTTNSAMKHHVQGHEQSDALLIIMQEVNKLKAQFGNEREIHRQEIISLNEQLNDLKA